MNGYVLYKLHDSVYSKKLPKDYTSFDFIADWLQEVEAEEPQDVSSASSSEDDDHQLAYKQHRRKWWQTEPGCRIRLTKPNHFLEDARHKYVKSVVRTNDDGEAVVARLDLRRDCIYCGERNCYTFCSICMVPLCIGDCSRNFHTTALLPLLK